MAGFGVAGIFKQAATKGATGKLRKAFGKFQTAQRESMGVKKKDKKGSRYSRFVSAQKEAMKPKKNEDDPIYDK